MLNITQATKNVIQSKADPRMGMFEPKHVLVMTMDHLDCVQDDVDFFNQYCHVIVTYNSGLIGMRQRTETLVKDLNSKAMVMAAPKSQDDVGKFPKNALYITDNPHVEKLLKQEQRNVETIFGGTLYKQDMKKAIEKFILQQN